MPLTVAQLCFVGLAIVLVVVLARAALRANDESSWTATMAVAARNRLEQARAVEPAARPGSARSDTRELDSAPLRHALALGERARARSGDIQADVRAASGGAHARPR